MESIMKVEEYSKEVIKTAIYPNIGENFNYPFKGLVDEFGEVLEILWGYEQGNLDKEIGDVFWFGNALSHEMGFDFSTIVKSVELNYRTFDDIVIGMFLEITKMAGHLKKLERDGNKEKIELVKISLQRFFTGMLLIIKNRSKITVNEILQLNYEKLISRQKRNVLTGDGDNR